MSMNLVQLARTDLNLLVLFDAVLAHRNVGRAAKTLNLTPSAVSHGLGRLRRLLNDPLFLRTPKGMTPTARALELANPIADILTRVGGVIATAEPFDPASARRRFMIGATDGITPVFLTRLRETLDRASPGIDLGLRQYMPEAGRDATEMWRITLADLEARHIDLAVLPIGQAPTRFAVRKLLDEDFVVAMRRGHPFTHNPTLAAYCKARHLLVSQSGNPRSFVDDLLARQGLSRRVAMTVPSFMMALAQIAESDLIATLPRHLVQRHADRFDLVAAPLPLHRKPDAISAIVAKAALADKGVAWIFDKLIDAAAVRSRRAT
jgi:DNA-binding transcriptional LysR family regulator